MGEARAAIHARNLSVQYDLRLTRDLTVRRLVANLARRNGHARRKQIWALNDVSFSLEPGEILGVLGRNGAGKSTLLLTIAGILRPDRGTIDTFGSRATLLTISSGFERDLTGRENIYLQAAYLGLSRSAVDERIDEIIDFTELGGFIDVPMRQYSSGMRVRLGFSVAAHIEPEILLLDEVFSVGDISFNRKSIAKVNELIAKAKAIVLVSHNTQLVTRTCTKAIWIENGRLAAFGEPEEVAEKYVADIDRPFAAF